jgi:hypothetical protein
MIMELRDSPIRKYQGRLLIFVALSCGVDISDGEFSTWIGHFYEISINNSNFNNHRLTISITIPNHGPFVQISSLLGSILGQ